MPVETSEISDLISSVQVRLTLEGRKRVFEQKRELRTNDINERQDPEEFTRSFLIDGILFDILKLKLIGRNRKFQTPDGERKVDYALQHEDLKILVEAKPMNADLKTKSKDGAVNQIMGVFRLVEVEKEFDFGIATDGLLWIFINKERQIIAELNIREKFDRIKKYLIGHERLPKRKLEEISKKFYEEYNDLLHGIDRIPKSESLVQSILNVDNEDDREEIAQITVNRLIFIKFLETINIIRGEVLEYLRNLEEHNLNLKLFQLFFEVMNTKKENRGSIDPRFADIPYLNGSLFEPLEVERKHQQYRIKAEILKRIIDFLGRFRFARYESLDGEDESIDPEILGYIFERSMTAKDRKGTGAYYTPREITKYIAKNCIYPIILEKSNYFLEKNRGYKKSELLSSVDEILILPATSQKVILNDIILKLTVCDNACGSGSFLLAAANVLFELARNVNDNLGTPFTDIYLKKQILRSLYGVDINSRAVEIAHLRLWLWLIESYTSDYIEPLPNIEYNLEVGNSLIGYVDMEAFGKTKVTLDDFTGSEESAKLLLSRFVDLKSTYGAAFGNEARKLRERIEDVRDKLQRQLDREAYIEISHKLGIDINRQEFLRLKPFHYGFEFYEIFDLELPKFERGFDVVIGNPPYVDSEEMVKNQQKFRDILSETYDSAVGNWDLYVPFFERAMQITTVGGIVCFISPNKWLSIGYGESLRHMFAKQLIRLCNCDEIDVFQDADNSPVISFFKKQDLSSEVMVDYFRADYQVIAMSPAPRKILELDNWGILISKYINTLLIILNQKHQLAPEYCDVENPFTVSEAYELAKLVYDGKANEKEFKLINTGTIDRFQSLWGKKTTSYIKRKYKYPYVRKAEFKKLMPKRFEQSSSPKLIITGIRYFESFLDEDGSHVAGKSTIIIRNPKKANLKALNALLNSKLIGFYMREAFRTAGIQGGVNFSSSMVEIIPVPNLTASHISNLTKLHDKMVGYIENQYSIAISRTDNELDKFVYELYGLSDKDVDVITKYNMRS